MLFSGEIFFSGKGNIWQNVSFFLNHCLKKKTVYRGVYWLKRAVDWFVISSSTPWERLNIDTMIQRHRRCQRWSNRITLGLLQFRSFSGWRRDIPCATVGSPTVSYISLVGLSIEEERGGASAKNVQDHTNDLVVICSQCMGLPKVLPGHVAAPSCATARSLNGTLNNLNQCTAISRAMLLFPEKTISPKKWYLNILEKTSPISEKFSDVPTF